MTKTIRAGRFSGKPDAAMARLNASIHVDKRLYHQDIDGSLAHLRALADAGVISADAKNAIAQGLETIRQEITEGAFVFDEAQEDIHMNIERRLGELVGQDTAGRLHAGRSRNDQVALDTRLYVRETIDALDDELRALQRAFTTRALEHADTLMPGYTHLQPAQPITFGHHCLAYVAMLERDRGRFADARVRVNVSPLGAGALAGTPYPHKPETAANALGFAEVFVNSLDAVSDRDFAIEVVSACAICAMHLSRLGEEITLWTSPAFGFVALSDAFSTGSSIMPQKRNPDGAELLRAKAARVSGALMTLLSMMKGLPLAYAKDMQEDKEALFDALDTLADTLPVARGMVETLTPNKARMAQAAEQGGVGATDLADFLVLRRGAAFREAHQLVSRLAQEAERLGCEIQNVPLAAARGLDSRLDSDALATMAPLAALRARTSAGGAAPERVREAAQAWLARLA